MLVMGETIVRGRQGRSKGCVSGGAETDMGAPLFVIFCSAIKYNNKK